MTAIYGLIDPRDRTLRYIGQSKNPHQRLSAHRHDPASISMRRWVNDLKAEGERPELAVLSESVEEPDVVESNTIRFFQNEVGADLLNQRETTPEFYHRLRVSLRPKTLEALQAVKPGWRRSRFVEKAIWDRLEVEGYEFRPEGWDDESVVFDIPLVHDNGVVIG